MHQLGALRGDNGAILVRLSVWGQAGGTVHLDRGPYDERRGRQYLRVDPWKMQRGPQRGKHGAVGNDGTPSRGMISANVCPEDDWNPSWRSAP